MKRYRIIVRGQKGDFERVIRCEELQFKGSWWAVFVTAGEVIVAVPSEHLNLIELLPDP